MTLLKSVTEHMDYEAIIKKHPWIIEKGHECLLSPDSDGLLCGLLMSDFLGWKVAGFYDGKTLYKNKESKLEHCIFVDVEILRNNIRSFGHHMNVHNVRTLPEDYSHQMANCINPNHIRNFDRAHNFNQKYPLGSVHLLLFILEKVYPNLIDIKKDGMGVLFFADGVWKILFKYTDNFLDWFKYLDVDDKSKWWSKLKNLSVIELIEEINTLLLKMKEIHPENKSWYGHLEMSKEGDKV